MADKEDYIGAIIQGLGEYDTFVISEEYDEDYEAYIKELTTPKKWDVPKRLLRRAEMEKRKAKAKARRSRLDYYFDEDGVQVFYMYEPDDRIVGLLAHTPSPCGKWCVCRDRGRNYNREAYKKRTRQEIEWEN